MTLAVVRDGGAMGPSAKDILIRSGALPADATDAQFRDFIAAFATTAAGPAATAADAAAARARGAVTDVEAAIQAAIAAEAQARAATQAIPDTVATAVRGKLDKAVFNALGLRPSTGISAGGKGYPFGIRLGEQSVLLMDEDMQWLANAFGVPRDGKMSLGGTTLSGRTSNYATVCLYGGAPLFGVRADGRFEVESLKSFGDAEVHGALTLGATSVSGRSSNYLWALVEGGATVGGWLPDGTLVVEALHVIGDTTNGGAPSSEALAADFVLPDVLQLTAGRPSTIRPINGASHQTPGSFRFALNSSPASDIGAAVGPGSALQESLNELIIDPATIGPQAEVVIYDRARPLQPYLWTFATAIAPSTSSAAPAVLMIGDSLTQYMELPNLTRDELGTRGMTPTFVGTILSYSGSATSPSILCEGRGGRKFLDYIHAVTPGSPLDYMAPVAIGSEAAYLAMDDGQKEAFNPFIRASTGGDPSGMVRNGYIVDFAQYRSRFVPGQPAPSHIIIELGTNDIDQGDDALAATGINDGLAILYARARLAFPSAKIGLLSLITGASPTVSNRKIRHHDLLLGPMKRFVMAKGDPNLSIIPAYLAQSSIGGWAHTINSTDANGLKSATVLGELHFTGSERRIIAHQIASWIGTTV